MQSPTSSSPSQLSHVSATPSSVSPTQPPPSPTRPPSPSISHTDRQCSVPLTLRVRHLPFGDRLPQQEPSQDQHPQVDAPLHPSQQSQPKLELIKKTLHLGLLHERDPTRAFSAIRLLEHRPTCILTQCHTLNQALNPGLHPRRVTQLCGQSLTGKTAIALELATSVLLADGGVLWFETTHSPWEIQTHLSESLFRSSPTSSFPHSSNPSRTNSDTISALPHMRLAVFPVPNFDAAMLAMSAVQRDVLLLRELKHLSVSNDTQNNNLIQVLSNLKLVVFDAVATILSPLLGLRLPPSWTGHVALDQISALLRWLANETAAAVLITNRLVSTTSVPHPALGAKWAAFVDVSICLSRDSNSGSHQSSQSSLPNSPLIISVKVASKFDRSRATRLAITDGGLKDIDSSQTG